MEKIRTYTLADIEEILPSPAPPTGKRRVRQCQSKLVVVNGTEDEPDEEMAERLLRMALEKAHNSDGRNDTGFWLACQLRDNGFDEEAAECIMMDYHGQVPSTDLKGIANPYTEEEVLSSLRQAYSQEARDPMTMPDSGKSIDEFLEDLFDEVNADPGRGLRQVLTEDSLWLFAKYQREDQAAYGELMRSIKDAGIDDVGIERLEREVIRFRRENEEPVDDHVYSLRDDFPDSPIPPGLLPPSGYNVDMTGVYRYAENPKTSPGGIQIAPTPIVIIERRLDIDSTSERLTVLWRRDGEWRQLTEDRGVLRNARKIVGLADFGFPVSSPTAKTIVDYLVAFEATNITHIPKISITYHMGWQGEAGELGFMCGEQHITQGGVNHG